MIYSWFTKRRFLQALKNGKIFLTKQTIRRCTVTGYNVYILYKNHMHLIKGFAPCWSEMYECYRPSGTGYNKAEHIIEEIVTIHLGYKIKDGKVIK